MATASVTNQFTSGTTIVSDDVDTNFADLVTFLNGSVLHLDGAKAMSGDLDMGNQDINNVPWKAWSPSYENLTIGNGTVVSRYIQIGDLVIARFEWVWGSTSSWDSTSASITLPVTINASGYTDTNPIGLANLRDVGVLSGMGWVEVASGKAVIRAARSSGTHTDLVGVSATVPFTWTTGDILAWNVSYEAA